MNWRAKIVILSDRVICGLIVVLVLGSVLGFGGAVWWFRPVLSVAAFLLVAIKLAQSLATGKMPILKSPLGLLGLLALGLGVVQLAPLPAGLASRLSPTAHEIYSRGLLPRLVHTDDPEAILPESPQIRSPASLDRSATLRWLVASCCLPGDLLVRIPFHRPPGKTLPGLGTCGCRVPSQRGPGDRADHKPERRALRSLRSRQRSFLGPFLE